jgi:hypothetical protein
MSFSFQCEVRRETVLAMKPVMLAREHRMVDFDF